MYKFHQTIPQNYTLTTLNSKTQIQNKKAKQILYNSELNNNVIKKNYKYLKLSNIDLINYNNIITPLNSNNSIIKIYIKTTLNNMFITYVVNNKIITKSLSAIGFKGKAKQTTYAYKTFAELLVSELFNLNITNIIVNIYAQSLNYKLKVFFKIFKTNNIKINKIYDMTPIPYNGCRKKKISIKKKKKSVIKFLSYR